MAYCFHAGESVRDAVRRIGLEQIDSILADLRAGLNAPRIHDARKRCKMLRALLHLVRGGLDPKARRAGITRWRTVADSLGRARDAAVRLDTFRSLVTRPNSCRELARRLEAEADEARRSSLDSAALKRLATRVNAGRRTWERMPLAHHGWRVIAPGPRASYREAREALQAIRGDSSDQVLHDCRKRMKTLWYHLRLLGKARPKKLRPLSAALETIGELLGADHDLAMLRAYAIEHDSSSVDVLDPLIAHRRRKLQRKALALARPLFQPRPRDFSAQLKKWWQDWRS